MEKEFLKTNTLFELLKLEKVAIYQDLSHLELIEEDFDGEEMYRINADLSQLDKDLNGLSGLKINKTTIELDNLKFTYDRPQQFLASENGQLYIILVNEYLRKRNIDKSIFLIYDYDVDNFGLCISRNAVFRELCEIIANLKKLELDNPLRAAEYINIRTPRVMEVWGSKFGKAIFVNCIIHRA